MNITILSNRDLASYIALDRLVEALSDHRLAIFISEKIGGDLRLPQPLLDLAAFEKHIMQSSDCSFEALAVRANCILQGFVDLDNRLNSPAGIVRISASQPDLIISVRFGLILRQAVISLPKYGVINLHSGVLPDYRGVMATFRAMLNHEAKIGSTLHFISDAAVDSGDILSIAKLPLDRRKSYLLNVLSLYSRGCQQLLEAVQTLQSHKKLKAQPQCGRACYYGFPTQSELDVFFARGYRLFDTADSTKIKSLRG